MPAHSDAEFRQGVEARGDATGPAAAQVLFVLRIALHIGFAALLAVGMARVLPAGPGEVRNWLTLLLALVLAGVYWVGTLAEKRSAEGRSVFSGVQPGRYATVWLAMVLVMWLVLLAANGAFSWLAFPLFFLQLHLLHTRHAVVAVAMSAAAVVAAQWYHNGELHLAMVLGPLFGAGFAVVMALVYQALYAEGVKQRRALAELLRTREELAKSQHEAGVVAERERLAREIHDTLAQGLSSIFLISRAADAALSAGEVPLAQDRIRTVQTAASENLTEARRFVRGLSSAEPAQESLVEKLRRACDSVEREDSARGGRLRCRFQLVGVPVRMAAPYEVALLRAAQSTLANVAQHAHAGAAVLTLSFLDTEVTMDIFDDGLGFDAGTALSTAHVRPDGTGYGLLSVRERVSALGGRIDIESAPHEGTVVALTLPLARSTLGDADG